MSEGRFFCLPVPFRHLQLTNFRNYAALEWALPGRVHCLTGPNGAGKTNLLEAIHFLCAARGFQAERYAVREGETFFMIESELEGHPVIQNLTCSYLQGKGKKMVVDGRPLAKLSEHLGQAPVVAVTPGDVDLIYGGGAERRNWLDGLVSQFDRTYLEACIRYDQAIKQRNALLAAFAERGRFDVEQLRLWDGPLSEAGRVIRAGRAQFVEAFTPFFQNFYQSIIPDGETPDLRYESAFVENSSDEWTRLLRASEYKDRAVQRTQTGVHKDSVEFFIDGQPLRYYGSQGQQKTFITALKFAQYAYLAERTGKQPVLLLDDVFDKLDAGRVGAITSLIMEAFGGQTFITDTSAARLREVFRTFDQPTYYRVGGGQVQLL